MLPNDSGLEIKCKMIQKHNINLISWVNVNYAIKQESII